MSRPRQNIRKRRSAARATRTEPTVAATVVRSLRRAAKFADHPVLCRGLAVGLGAVGVFVTLALASFHPADPDFDHAAAPQYIENLGGVVGAYLAGTLWRRLGLAAWLLPVVCFGAAAELVLDRPRTPLPLRVAAALLLLFTTAALIALVWPDAVLYGLPAGGWVGQVLGDELVRRYLGVAGIVLLLPVWGLALYGAIGASALTAAGQAGRRGVGGASRPFAELGVRLRNWWRHRRQRRQAKPETVKKVKKLSLDTAPEAGPAQPSPELRSSVPADATEPGLQIQKPQPLRRAKTAVQRPLVTPDTDWVLPDLDLLDRPSGGDSDVDEKLLRAKAQLLAAKIREYGIEGQVTAVRPGPVISVYEFKPAPGVKVSRIANLEDDLALATESLSVRIVAPIPGRDVVGIEIPNKQREPVALREIIESEGFWNKTISLPFAIGKDTGGAPIVADIAKMPHLLVAGATGAGKSVGINSLIVSLLYRHSPETLRLFLIDPKRLELSFYSDIPHLEGHEVVTDPHEAFALLDALVREMEERYEWMAHAKVRNIKTYNRAVEEGRVEPRDGEAPRKMPFLVCIVDELADLMMVTRKQIEEPIARLAQMARAAGIHLVLATQRPSVDVLTGLIKANFPTRIAFKVSSKADARVVLDQQGAENLLGQGDMLFKPPTSDIPQRVHGAFVSEEEVTRVTGFWKTQAEERGAPAPAVSEDLIQESLQRVRGGDGGGGAAAGDVEDELFEKAVDIAAREGVVSTSRIQRALSIGYNRAARIMDAMEARGMVGPQTGAGKPRKFLGAGGGVDG